MVVISEDRYITGGHSGKQELFLERLLGIARLLLAIKDNLLPEISLICSLPSVHSGNQGSVLKLGEKIGRE